MSYPTKSYSAYVKRLCALTGIPQNGLTSDEENFFQEYFQTNFSEAWTRYNWTEICPYGEARLVGNLFSAANQLGSVWTGVSGTTANNIQANPADGQVTAGTFTEDTSGNLHYLASGINTSGNYVPGTYSFSAYIRPNGRNYVQLLFSDDNSTYTAVFTLTGNGATSSASGCTATCNLTANGFYLCQINFTATISSTSYYGRITLQDSATNQIYIGNGSSGVAVWGLWAGQAQNVPLNQLIALNQTGETAIDTVFMVWKDNPNLVSFPRPQGYLMTGDGLMIIGAGGTGYTYGWGVTPNTAFSGQILPTNLAYLYYRPVAPDFSGETFDATASYAVGDTILFTDSDDVQNFWECLANTSPSQSPATNPSSWELIPIPEIFFKYIVYGAYADWLRQDGQMDKASAADDTAEEQLMTEFDRQQRQMGNVAPMRVSTHVTSQPRY